MQCSTEWVQVRLMDAMSRNVWMVGASLAKGWKWFGVFLAMSARALSCWVPLLSTPPNVIPTVAAITATYGYMGDPVPPLIDTSISSDRPFARYLNLIHHNYIICLCEFTLLLYIQLSRIMFVRLLPFPVHGSSNRTVPSLAAPFWNLPAIQTVQPRASHYCCTAPVSSLWKGECHHHLPSSISQRLQPSCHLDPEANRHAFVYQPAFSPVKSLLHVLSNIASIRILRGI